MGPWNSSGRSSISVLARIFPAQGALEFYRSPSVLQNYSVFIIISFANRNAGIGVTATERTSSKCLHKTPGVNRTVFNGRQLQQSKKSQIDYKILFRGAW